MKIEIVKPPRRRYKIWYDDGSTYADLDGPPENAPKRGVQFIAVEDRNHGRLLMRNDDFYIWGVYDGEEHWQGADYAGLMDYLFQPGWKIVLFGRTIGRQALADLVGIVTRDTYLPAKTASYPGE